MPIAVQKQAKVDIKLFLACPVLLDFSILFQIFFPGLWMWKFWLLHKSKSNNFSECSVSVTSWFHRDFIIIILLIFHGLMLLVICGIVALMITDSQMCEWKIMKTEKRRKKGRETWYFNFKPQNWILEFLTIYSFHNSCDLPWSEIDNMQKQ